LHKLLTAHGFKNYIYPGIIDESPLVDDFYLSIEDICHYKKLVSMVTVYLPECDRQKKACRTMYTTNCPSLQI